MFKKVLFILSAVFLFSAMAHNAFADVSAQLEQAVAYAEDDDDEQAETIYKTIIQNYPGTNYAQEAQRRLTILYIFSDKLSQADAALQAVLAEFSLEESTPEAVIQVADIYFRLGRHQKALELFQYCLDKWPDGEQAIWSHLGVAVSNIALGNDANAQAAVDNLLTDFSEHERLIEAFVDIGDTYRESYRYEEALQYYQYSVDHWPDDAENAIWAQVGVAVSNIALGNDANAQAAVDKLLTDFSEHNQISAAAIEIIEIVADTYLDSGRYEKAGELYQCVIDNWPESKYAIWFQRGVGMLNAALDNDAAVEAVIDGLIADFSDQAGLPAAVSGIAEQYYNRALQMESEELVDQAQNHFQKAIAIYEIVADVLPSSGDATPEACCLVGVCYRKLSEYENSIEYYQKVVNDYPTYRLTWHALFMVGRNYESLKKSGGVSSSEADAKIKAAYEQLLEKYPACKAARYARYWLSRHNSK